MEIYERPSSTIEIPYDIVEGIMVRLPVRSVIRFQVVSKHWRSLARSKTFGERYTAHHKSKDPKLLFISHGIHNICFEQRALDKTCTCLEDLKFLDVEEEIKGCLEISQCCDGVFCFYQFLKPVQVINVATKTLITLPLARYQRHPTEVVPVIDYSTFPKTLIRFGFGINRVTGLYKLVWLYNVYPYSATSLLRCEVLDLEDKERKWRLVTTRPLVHVYIWYEQRPTFADGFIYWLTGDHQGYPSTQTKLIVFDIHSEMFRITAIPPFISRDAYGDHDQIGVCNLDGRLCISELKGDDKQDFWWRGKDDTTWDKIFSLDLNSTSKWFGGISSIPLTPLAIFNNKVILSSTERENLVAFDLDPDSPLYHLFHSGYYAFVVPYFPSLALFHANF